MADKTTELERVYTIPLRKAKDLTRSKRANNAIRDIKRFLNRHMKSENVWLDQAVNELIWSRGKFTIPSKVRVRATRFSDGVVEVTLPEQDITGSVREQVQARRTKAAETPVLKGGKVPDEEGDDHGHGPNAERPVTDVKGIGPATAEKLVKAGFETLHDLMHADAKKVVDAIGGTEERAQGWINDAKAIVEGKTDVADVKAQPAIEAAKDAKSDKKAE